MSYVFPPPPTTAVPVAGSDLLFPVRRVYCVGRNYAGHAREMGSDPAREPPFFFAKPADAVVPVAAGSCADLAYPGATGNFQHEIELVAAIGCGGSNISSADAKRYLWGYAIGLDMTRRDLQLAQRDQGRPWEIGKAFDASAPIGPITPAAAVQAIEQAAIWLTVNGLERQRSTIGHLTWNVFETIAQLSRYFTLAPGDLVFTGTPEGVGKILRGDRLRGGIDGLGELEVRIV